MALVREQQTTVDESIAEALVAQKQEEALRHNESRLAWLVQTFSHIKYRSLSNMKGSCFNSWKVEVGPSQPPVAPTVAYACTLYSRAPLCTECSTNTARHRSVQSSAR